MIANQWPRAASLPSAARCARCFSQHRGPQDSPPTWPNLKKRSRRPPRATSQKQPRNAPPPDQPRTLAAALSEPSALKLAFAKPSDPVLRGRSNRTPSTRPSSSSSSPLEPKENHSRRMLVVQGLSTNLSASDFHRLAPNDLANWQGAIQKVQQQRDSRTFEPLGRYHLSFATAEAAAAYRDKLIRLHRLARHKLASSSGLWESSVPTALLASDDPARELDAFTVAPASLAALDMESRRVAVTHPWAKSLSRMVAELGSWDEEPAIVLMEVYPPTLTAEDLYGFIWSDGVKRGSRWRVTRPYRLLPTKSERVGGGSPEGRDAEAYGPSEQENDQGEGTASAEAVPDVGAKDFATREKLRSCFVIACANDSEARRLHRSWNQRTLTPRKAGRGSSIVSASIINW